MHYQRWCGHRYCSYSCSWWRCFLLLLMSLHRPVSVWKIASEKEQEKNYAQFKTRRDKKRKPRMEKAIEVMTRTTDSLLMKAVGLTVAKFGCNFVLCVRVMFDQATRHSQNSCCCHHCNRTLCTSLTDCDGAYLSLLCSLFLPNISYIFLSLRISLLSLFTKPICILWYLSF